MGIRVKNWVMAMVEAKNDEFQIEFMRKTRFVALEKEFKAISPEAKEVVKNANDTDILLLRLRFTSPTLSVIQAEVCDEKKFIELAF